MNARERILAVVHRQQPDKIPFAPFEEYLVRGDFEREMFNRGMGMVTRNLLWRSEFPHVDFERRVAGDQTETIAHTPAGSLSTSMVTHLDRQATDGRALNRSGWLKSEADYEALIFMVDDEVFYPDYEAYEQLTRAFGGDGVVRSARFDAPFWEAYRLFGIGSPEGATNFVYHQRDHARQFARLIEALERRNERLFPIFAGSPAGLVELGAVNGVYGPVQYEKYFLPFVLKYRPLLEARGKIVYPHAHSSQLKNYVDLLTRAGYGMLDAFTPPPVGNLTLGEARAVWGDHMIISLNIPETIFWNGPAYCRRYILDLLEQNAGGPLLFTMTEIGTSMIVDDPMEQAFKDGLRAIMDAIDEFCGCRQVAPHLERTKL